MKRIAAALFIAALIIPAAAAAQETPTIALTAPAGLVQQACPQPVWQNASFVWKGVTDKRTSPELGAQTQKGKDPIPVMASPPIAQAFDATLRDLLPACGMKLSDKGGADAIELSAEIREFYTGVEKKFFTGKSTAKSSIAFHTRQGGRSSSVTVGCELESKKVRSGDIKQLQKTVNELFVETLKQIPATQEMKDLK